MLIALSCAFAFLGFLAGTLGHGNGNGTSSLPQWRRRIAGLWKIGKGQGEPLSSKWSLRRRHDPVAEGPEQGFQLLTKSQVEAQFDMHTWQRLAYEDLKMTLLAKGAGLKTFPCVYATMGYRADDHRYLFLRSDNPAEPQNIRLIGPALRAYLELAPRLGDNTSLVIIGAPSAATGKSVAAYNASFWDMLRGLRCCDPAAWPREVPPATASEKWTFCFAGQPVFPVLLTPAHASRWSRHMSVPLIALQPKWVLDKLLSTAEKRESATAKVRRLLVDYDSIDISPDLTSYGQPGTTEARQLCLLDENETADCPYEDLDR